MFFRTVKKRRRENGHFDFHLWRIRTVHFLSKDGKSASSEGRDGWKICFFPARVGIFIFDFILLDSDFHYLYIDLACKQLCFPPAKGINRRNESTISEFFRTFSKIIVQLILIDSSDDIITVFTFCFSFKYWNFKPPILLSPKKDNQIITIKNAFTVETATRNKKKLVASNKKN